jgi:hypothetical protein
MKIEKSLSLSLSLSLSTQMGQASTRECFKRAEYNRLSACHFIGCGTINKTGVKDNKFRSICQVKNEYFYFTFSKQLI